MSEQIRSVTIYFRDSGDHAFEAIVSGYGNCNTTTLGQLKTSNYQDLFDWLDPFFGRADRERGEALEAARDKLVQQLAEAQRRVTA